MFKIMKHCKYGQPKSNHYSDKFYVNSAAGSDVVQIGNWRCDTNIKKTGKGLLFTEVPFRIEQGSLPKEAQNCFKKNTERRLVFWPLVARPGVGAQFYSCRQGLAWIELLSCNPDPGTKGESTRASWSTCLNMGQREKGALKTASRTSTVVSWLRLCTFIVEGMCSISGWESSACQVVLGCQLEGFHGGPGTICQPTQETWVRSLGQEDPLEKKMTSHSSIAAWEMPWAEKPGRLRFMGSQKSWTWFSDKTAVSTWRQFPRFLGNWNLVQVLS